MRLAVANCRKVRRFSVRARRGAEADSFRQWPRKVVLEITVMRNLLLRLVREESGQDIIEYALLAAGIAVLMIPIVPQIGQAVNAVYGRINTQVGLIP